MTKKKMMFRRFDVAEHLDSPERIAGFLAVAIEEADGDLARLTRWRVPRT
jgi:DNA-binding phage protein